MIAAGYEDTNDDDYLRADSAFKLAVDRLPGVERNGNSLGLHRGSQSVGLRGGLRPTPVRSTGSGRSGIRNANGTPDRGGQLQNAARPARFASVRMGAIPVAAICIDRS